MHTVVNIGAKWDGHRKQSTVNRDFAWELAADRKQYRIIGFEAMQKAYETTQRVLTLSEPGNGGKFRAADLNPRRATLLNESVSPHTLCDRLRMLGVQAGGGDPLLLLKVDIDSMDLPVVQAALQCGLAPRMIFVEINEYLHRPLRFAALAPPAHPPEGFPPPRYGLGYRGWNNLWPCMGASLSMWAHALAPHYALLTTDDVSNALFVPTAAHRAHFAAMSTALSCHDYATNGSMPRRRAIRRGFRPDLSVAAYVAAARSLIGDRCRATNTSYTLTEAEDDEKTADA